MPIAPGPGEVTTSATVNLNVTLPSDPSLPLSMCVSNGTTCVAWQTARTSLSWTLSGGTGLKTVRVWFRDAYSNTTATAVADTVTY